MKRSTLKRTSQLKRSAFKSAFVRHTPFSPNSTLKRKAAISGVKESENGSSKPVGANTGASSGLRKVGKKGREWVKARKWLSRHFQFAGIIYCEARLNGCWLDNGLSFGHCRKRRKLLEGEIYHVALLCTPCHNHWEVLPHDEMHAKIHSIIDKRGLIAPAA